MPDTPEERQAKLESELDQSLSDFDRRMRQEQEILAKNRPQGAGGAYGSSPPAGQSGGGQSSAGAEGASSAGAAGPSGEPGSRNTATGEDGPGVSGGGSVGGGGAESGSDERGDRVPADVGTGGDDDIVARQLREAAMSEDDPQLRERLWDEYRAYKSGRRPAARDSHEGDSDSDDEDPR